MVRMGFTGRQRRRVAVEVAALQALQPLQGLDVPRLLAHGRTHEGHAYAVTEQVQVCGHSSNASSPISQSRSAV